MYRHRYQVFLQGEPLTPRSGISPWEAKAVVEVQGAQPAPSEFAFEELEAGGLGGLRQRGAGCGAVSWGVPRSAERRESDLSAAGSRKGPSLASLHARSRWSALGAPAGGLELHPGGCTARVRRQEALENSALSAPCKAPGPWHRSSPPPYDPAGSHPGPRGAGDALLGPPRPELRCALGAPDTATAQMTSPPQALASPPPPARSGAPLQPPPRLLQVPSAVPGPALPGQTRPLAQGSLPASWGARRWAPPRSEPQFT